MNVGQVANAIERVGQPVTLRRLTGPQKFVSVSVKARMDTPPRQHDETPGGVKQYLQQFTISNREITRRQWPGPPRRGDQVVTAEGNTSTVQSVDARRIGADVALFVLQTIGGP